MSDPAAPGARRARWLAPLAVAAAVVAVAAATFAGMPDGDDDPPPLGLSQVAGSRLGEAGAEPAVGAPDGGPYGWGEWKLEGNLPDGPSEAPIHRLPGAATDRSLFVRLADSLDLEADPQDLDGGWYAVKGTAELSVSERSGRHWVYADHGCVAGPVLDPHTGVACAVAEPAGVSTPEPRPSSGAAPGPTGEPRVTPAPSPSPAPVNEDEARRIARPVLEAVGLDPSAAEVQTWGSRRDVVVRPVIDGTKVIGLDTRISVAPDGDIEDASGWLATPVRGAVYRVISARAAFEQLRDQPRPMAAEMPCEIPPGATACPAPPARVVTGAMLGLAQAYEGAGRVLLVPAWLFEVRDQPEAAVVSAIDPKFLEPPDEPVPGGSSGGGSGGSVPRPATANPTQVDPAPPVEPAPRP